MITTDNDNQRDTMASHTNTSAVISPAEKPVKERKGNNFRAFFKRVWKSAKQADDEHLPVSGPSTIKEATDTGHADPELVCLPGQVFDSLPGPSRIEQIVDADSTVPESSFFTLEKPVKERKGTKVQAFFKRVWKTAKRPFRCCDPSRVVPLAPQAVIDDFEHLPVPSPSAVKETTDTEHDDPELVCLPGQVFEDPQPLSLPGPSRINQTTDVLNADPAGPELSTTDTDQVCDTLESVSSPGPSRIEQIADADSAGPVSSSPVQDLPRIDVTNEKPVKERNGKKVHAFFKRVWKTAKHPFHCCDPSRVVPLAPQAVIDDFEHLPVPSPSAVKETTDTEHDDPELVCLPGQVFEDPQPLSRPGPSRIKQTTDVLSADPAGPELSTTDTDQVSDSLESVSSPGPSRIEQIADADSAGPASSSPVQDLPRIDVTNDGSVPVPVQITPEIAEPPNPRPDPEPDPEPSCSELDNRTLFTNFQVGRLIGTGSYGNVHLASHRFIRRFKVAMKFIVKRPNDRYLNVDGFNKPVLAELAMLLRLGKPPICPNIIKLLHWIENETNFIFVMEYPESCQTLGEYIFSSEDIKEDQARGLMHQLLSAVKCCVERGVFHGDMHSGNILLSRPGLELKLIDFGSARTITGMPFKSSKYQGALHNSPPEVLQHPTFHANPAYVWGLGVVLYQILHRYLPFNDHISVMRGDLEMDCTLSSDCRNLISKCLKRNPAKRLQLNKLEEHRWFSAVTPDTEHQ